MESPRALLGKISWRLSATKLMIKITNSVLLSSMMGQGFVYSQGSAKPKCETTCLTVIRASAGH